MLTKVTQIKRIQPKKQTQQKQIDEIVENIKALTINQVKITSFLKAQVKKNFEKTETKPKEKCYYCGKEFGEYEKKLIRKVSESPKDDIGIKVPICEKCYSEKYLTSSF